MEGNRTRTMTMTTMSAVMAAITALLFIVPDVNAGLAGSTMKVVIQNNHTSYLSIRCFSFEKSLDLKHLSSGEEYIIKLKVRTIFPSATMYNCSTNMGTFVAFRHNYPCSIDDSVSVCYWKFDEKMTYLYNPANKIWVAFEYNPNYESLDRGGVIKGYFVN